jgi:hypothetical protein
MCSPYVISVFKSTISFIFGWVNTANVFLITAGPAFGPRKKFGTAFNAPPVIFSKAELVLKCMIICWDTDFHNLLLSRANTEFYQRIWTPPEVL